MKIEYLQVYTSQLQKQAQFYRDVLDFSLAKNVEDSFTIKIGFTEVCFQYKKEAKLNHIAFHIPANQEKSALEWLKKRVNIEKNGTEEIIDFKNWEAKSVYFKDANDNILEFISRSHLYSSQKNKFSVNSILGVAEVGLAVEIIEPFYNYLHDHFNLTIFDGNLERFCAIGDEEGLLICIDKNKKEWSPTNQTAFVADFEIKFKHQGEAFNFISKDV